MDFISNLIKRPISLVLNDSSASAHSEHSQSPTKSTADTAVASTTTAIIPAAATGSAKRATTPPFSLGGTSNSSLFAAAMNTSINAHIVADTTPTTATTPVLLQNSGNCSSPSSAIENLLLQINDNLNLADLQDESNVSSASNSSLSTLASAELSPLPNKTQPTKMTPSPRPLIATHNINAVAAVGATNAAAGSAVCETNSPPTAKVRATSVVDTAAIVDNLPNVNNSEGNRTPHIFSGISTYDESNIPELPGSLNPNIEDQLALTFEEGLIPMLTANVNTDFNSTAIQKDSANNNKVHLVVNYDTDTAPSSDNETYVECQSYQDFTSEPGTEASELEAYCSALNTTATNAVGIADDTLNATMANVPDLNDELVGIKAANEVFLKAEKQAIALNMSDGHNMFVDGEEPMDVDISFTQEQYETNVTALVEDVAPNVEKSTEEAKLSQQTQPTVPEIVTNETETANNTLQQTEQTANVTVTASLLPAVDFSQSSELDIEQSTYEVLHDKSVELPIGPSNLEQTHCATAAAAKLPTLVENKSVAEEIQRAENLPLKSLSGKDTASEKSPTSSDLNLNLTLEMNSSCSSLKSTSSTSSTTFPLKNKSFEIKQFPRSPKSEEAEKKTRFLEKSEYAERLNARKTSIKLTPCSPEQVLSGQTNDNADVESQKSTSPAAEHTAQTLNGTFAASPPSTPNKMLTPNASSGEESFRTFNIQAQSNATDELKAATAVSIDMHRRRTFDLPAVTTLTTTPNKEFNTSFEPMDIDFGMGSTNIATKSASTLDVVNQVTEDSASPAALLPCLESEGQFKVPFAPVRSPPIPTMLKRPPIHSLELLSDKEQTHINARDEKDVASEKYATPSPLDEMFTAGTLGTFSGFGASAAATDNEGNSQEFSDDEFKHNDDLILNPSDFDYLLTKGNNNAQNTHVDRSSLLLRFDPLLGVPVLVNQPQQQQLQLQQILASNNTPGQQLSPTIEEDEPQTRHQQQQKQQPQPAGINSRSFIVTSAKPKEHPTAALTQNKRQPTNLQNQNLIQTAEPKKNASMSVDVIDNNDCNKTFENTNSQADEKQTNYKMDELEKKIKNEVLKTEDIEKKLKEAEQREEALIKRITDKDKTISKMNGVIEAYEKAIAELIAEKEQLKQNFEKQLAEVTVDRDSNYHHLASLETTFSDLHVKYEKSKEMTSQLKASEESLLSEQRQCLENLRLQEQRYEKMKNHAVQQLEIANKKIESLTKDHAIESTKLKALLKKEEISRASINEQLQQKSRENAELVKICDELINGQGS